MNGGGGGHTVARKTVAKILKAARHRPGSRAADVVAHALEGARLHDRCRHDRCRRLLLG